jgi:hypothetical protein
MTPALGSSSVAPPHLFKCLITEEMAECRRSWLCYNYDEPFTRGHTCKHLFDIIAINDYDNDDVDTASS